VGLLECVPGARLIDELVKEECWSHLLIEDTEETFLLMCSQPINQTYVMHDDIMRLQSLLTNTVSVFSCKL